MVKTVILYRLTDARGNQEIVVINDSQDNGRIGGYDADGRYRQYDSAELAYAFEWAEKHGMILECAETEIDLSEVVFQ